MGHLETDGVEHYLHVTEKRNKQRRKILLDARGRASGERGLSLLQWGLIPSWADDPTIGNRLINARAETVAEKPACRTAFKKRRCLVVADGFYEFIWTIPIPLPLRRGSGRSHRAQPRHDTRTSPAEFKNASVWRTDAQAKTTTNE